MGLLDLVLVAAALLFAVSGYRQGFVVGVLSLVGFLGGGLLGARLAPSVASVGLLDDLPTPAVSLVVVFVGASLGQVLAAVVGGAVRRRLTWRPARAVDAVAGSVVSVVSVLLVAWLVGRAVVSSPYPVLSSQVQGSVVLGRVDGLVPESGRRLFTSLRDLVDERGFPEVFDDLQRPDVGRVAAPDSGLVRSPVVEAARESVLKVTGEATACVRRNEGTGFVYAPGRVMTNAHVVAGVPRPRVEVGDRQLEARVVLYDPAVDVAVLAVPGLDRPALTFADGTAEPGDGALVVGYPLDGPFRPDPARISGVQEARGRDVYDSETVVREVYSVRGRVERGNSGGPLLDLRGQVLGVVFAAAADDPTVGYALTADAVADQARDGRSAQAAVSTRTCND